MPESATELKEIRRPITPDYLVINEPRLRVEATGIKLDKVAKWKRNANLQRVI